MGDLEKTDLPVGWVYITVDDAVISVSTNGKKILQKEYATDGRYVVVDQGQEHIGGYTDDAEKLLDCHLPVIIFGDHTKVIKYINQPFAAGADGIKVLQPLEFIETRFLEYSLRHVSESMVNKGYARHYQHLAKSVLLLPPLPEQKRIVAKIEELLSELDKGIESFKTAREQLKVYRQALLKHAFEGKLTAAWREANKGFDVVGAKQVSSASPAFDLCSKQDQSQNQKTKQKSKSGEADEALASPLQNHNQSKRRKPLPPLTVDELAELPKLPDGWGWVKLKSISDVTGGLTKNQKRNSLPNKLPFLRVANVYFNKLELDEMHEIGLNDSEIERVLLHKGDLLIVEGNGSVDQIGRVAIWNGIIPNCVHQNHLIKARPTSYVNTKFLLYFLMSELGRKFIVQVASSTSGLHTLSISKVEGLFIPLCHIEEQNQVLIELDGKLSALDNLDQTITTALQQSEALRQSILKKAFSGQLVPQDPNDEPASELLSRIKAERPSVGAIPTGRPNSRTAKSGRAVGVAPTKNVSKKINQMKG
jgi:type I restriction enzyme S subunit